MVVDVMIDVTAFTARAGIKIGEAVVTESEMKFELRFPKQAFITMMLVMKSMTMLLVHCE